MNKLIKTNEQLLSELQIECDKIGRMLSRREIDSNINISSYGAYNRRFKGLKNIANLVNFKYTGDIRKLKTDEQLLIELQIECNKIGRMLSYTDINNNTDLTCASAYINRFNGLENIANLIGFEYIGNNEKSKEQLLNELSIECHKIGRMLLTKEINNNKDISSSKAYLHHFNSLENVANLIGFEYLGKRGKSKEQLLNELSIECDKIGRMLLTREINNNKNISSCRTYTNHFNSLKNVANLIGFEYLGDKYKVSSCEIEVREYIKSITNNTIIYNDRNILNNNYELDIYIPELNIAIEYNGEYWHSSDKKEKDYHISKTLQCENKNITLIHIWDYEWKNEQDKLKEYIKEIIDGIINIAIPNKEGLVITDRMKPKEYSNVKVMKYTEPELIDIGREKCWNCGNIVYRVKMEII